MHGLQFFKYNRGVWKHGICALDRTKGNILVKNSVLIKRSGIEKSNLVIKDLSLVFVNSQTILLNPNLTNE